MSNPPRLALTLVNGTFAPEAAWAASGSPLRNHLARALGSETEFSSFSWSGQNTHAARLQAASDLAVQLESRIRVQPETQHFVIAHSHGGNVVLYALGLLPPECRRAIKGVISLATPFIRISPRSVDDALQVLPGFLGSLLALVLAIPAVLVLTHDGPGWLFGSLAFLASLTFVGVAASGWSRLEERFGPAIHSRQAFLTKAWTAYRSPGVPLLALTPDGDEALKGLRTFDRIGDAPFAVYACLVRVASSLFAVLGVVMRVTRIAKPLAEVSPILMLVIAIPSIVFLALALAAVSALGIVHFLLFLIPLTRKAMYFDHSALDYLHTSVMVGRWPARRPEEPLPSLPGIQLAKGLLDLFGSKLSPDDTLLDSDTRNAVLGSPPSRGSELVIYPTSFFERLRFRLRLYHSDIYNDERVLLQIQEWIVIQAASTV